MGSKNYSIITTEGKYTVVLAPGLTTTARKNPCSICSKGRKDKEACASRCVLNSARIRFMAEVGFGIPAIDTTAANKYRIADAASASEHRTRKYAGNRGLAI